MPDTFHFQHPVWFLALIPVLLLLWLMRQSAGHDTAWHRICDAGLLPYLLTGSAMRGSLLPLWLLATGWLLAVIALADPVWEQQPQPVFRNMAARIVVLDLSNSMLSPDLKPSRLARARYKVAGILKMSRDGQTGLVVFAGDAFTVSPLTSDTETTQALLAPLEPALMPVQGSRVDLGLAHAGKLLLQAGSHQGEILLVTDGFHDARALDTAARLQREGYRVSVLGVGTDTGAPVPTGRGGFLRNSQGDVVVPVLDRAALQQLATAGGGHYRTISNSDTDINYLLTPRAPLVSDVAKGSEVKTDIWQSHGAWLVLLLLPLAALVFRRGWLMVALPVMVSTLLIVPRPVMAFGWDDLWLRKDQQAARTLQAGNPAQAAALAQDPALRGTAAYQAEDFGQAQDAFAQATGVDADYNQGNALAQIGRYQEAIAAYARALTREPGMADALHNKAEVEKRLQQQRKQENPQQASDSEHQEGQESQDNQEGKNEQQAASDGDASRQATDETGNQSDRQAAASATEQHPQQSDEQSAARDDPQVGESAKARPLDSEEQLAAEQWLRRIPDDPGGLLRRKFLYQYRQRAGSTVTDEQQAW